METSDPDLIVNGVEDLKPMVFHPFSMYMRKQVAVTVNLSVGRKHDLGLRVDVLRYHGAGDQCTDNFRSKNVDGDGNCFFRSISSLLLGSEAKHDIVRSAVCKYIIQPDNWYKLKTYIDGDITSGQVVKIIFIKVKCMCGEMGNTCGNLCLGTANWQRCVCVYTLDCWMRYPASGTSKRPTKNAFYLVNHHNVHFDPILDVYTNVDSQSYTRS